MTLKEAKQKPSMMEVEMVHWKRELFVVLASSLGPQLPNLMLSCVELSSRECEYPGRDSFVLLNQDRTLNYPGHRSSVCNVSSLGVEDSDCGSEPEDLSVCLNDSIDLRLHLAGESQPCRSLNVGQRWQVS